MLILSFFTFSLTYLSPSDPVTLKYERMGAVPDREQLEKVKEEMGLNDPFLVQYARWLGRVLQGDLGDLTIIPPVSGIRFPAGSPTHCC